jgi:hypothetical protein
MFRSAHYLLAIAFAIAVSGSKANSAGLETKQGTIKLIASLDIHVSNIRQIRLGEGQGKNLLYLENAAKHAVTVVDVTNAAHPIVEKDVAMPDGFVGVETVAGDAALVVNRPGPALNGAESVAIVSFADSERHIVRRTFTNVTALAADAQRGLIYLVDQNGLKVLEKDPSPDPQLESENAWRYAP